MTPVLPAAALANHTGVLGKTGSGKTSTAKLIVEQIVAEGARVCVLDPIKSDWWGLISSADGKAAGLPFHVLGGPRAHVALHDGAGAAIGELVARGGLRLSIVDMALFPPGGQAKFFVDFAETLLKRMRGVVYLVLEEAHVFAPKERAGFGQENMSIHWAKMLATAGRSKGIRLVLVTQRTQALHNALLGSCETVIAHRLTAPADQKPVVDWLKANAAADIRKEVEASLSSLRTGTAWVCSGETQTFERRQFPRIATFDNTATPTDESGEQVVETAPIDAEGLRSLIGEAVRQAEADDPKRLKAEIQRLKDELARKPAAGAGVEELEAAAAKGQSLGYDLGFTDGAARAWRAAAEDMQLLEEMLQRVAAMRRQWSEAKGDLPPQPDALRQSTLAAAHRDDAPASPPPSQATALSAASVERPPAAADGLSGPQQRILNALAELASIGVHDAPRLQVMLLAGYGNPTSKGFANSLGSLSSGGYIAYPRPGLARLTPQGAAIAKAPARPSSSAELHQRVIEVLGGAHGRVLKPLLDAHPRSLSRAALLAAAGYGNATSKGFANTLGRLHTLGFVTYPERGAVAAADVLFLESRHGRP